MKKKIMLCFNNIEAKDKVRWRRAIRITLASLPPKHLDKIPDIYVYNTLVKALAETFNPEKKMVDSTGERYLKDRVWGFSFLNNPEERNRKIPEDRYQRVVLAIKRVFPGLEHATPEFTIFHEFGHFWFQSRGVVACKKNLEKLEQDCDEYAMNCYARLLDKYPFYRSIMEHERHEKFEGGIRKTLDKFRKKGLKGEKLYATAADYIMRKVGWKQ